MTLTHFVIIAGILFVIIFLGMLFLMPTEKKEKSRKKRKAIEVSVPLKPAEEEAVLRLQRHTHSLHEKIAAMEKEAKDREHHLAVERLRVEKLQEKLSQGREWHQKEDKALGKKGEEFRRLKEDISHVQDLLSREHAENLRQKQALEESARERDALQERRRALESENAQIKAKEENYRMEIARLRGENADLRRKEEDTAWVAKADYERLEILLREKDKQLQRIQRESGA
jgi:hypothetical protein